MMRFHVVSLPHTNTTKEFSVCAYTEKVRKFCDMMKMLNHTVYLYAGERNEANCDEHIVCIHEPQRRAIVGDKHYVEAPFEGAHWPIFNASVIGQMMRRIQPQDFICLITGTPAQIIAESFPANMAVEFGIGYSGVFSKYRVWESYAWMHTCYGAMAGNAAFSDGKAYDEVIPSYIDMRDFPFQGRKGDYFFYMGRFVDRKGYAIAMEACKRMGKRLLLAGPRPPEKFYWGEYIGELGPEERARFMGHAQALFVPTQYIEPFGTVAVEAMACGTPVITSDWGAFTETVVNGVNGFRCRTLQDYVDAMGRVNQLDYAVIRGMAMGKYSLEAVALKYDKYFNRLNTLWGEGWYTLREKTA